MKTKFFAFLLILSVMFSVVPAAYAAEETETNTSTSETVSTEDATEETTTEETVTKSIFKDLADDHVHYEAIEYLTKNAVIDGYEDGSFKPENTITRAEFVKMLSVFAGWDNLSTSGIITGFSDVDAQDENSTPHWANKHIKTAVENKIVNGMGDGTFAPDAPVTYEQVMKMLVCYLGYEDIAKNAAELENKELWPDGYLIQGNKLLISKNAMLAVGENAPRSVVAQMIYNIKDTMRIAAIGQSVISTPSISGGGGGDSSSKLTKWEKIQNGMNAYDISIHGHVVAAAKELKDGNKIYTYIDDNAKSFQGFKKNFFVAKCDKELNGSNYFLFSGPSTDAGYSHLIGHEVKIKFDYDSEYDYNAGAFKVSEIAYGDDYNTIKTINAKWIDIERTKAKIDSGTNCIVYIDQETEKYVQMPIPDDYSSINVMYNNILVGSETVETDDGEGGTVSVPTSISIEDLIISEGTIKFVTNASSGKVFKNGQYDTIFINAYDTYVAKTAPVSGSPRKLTDKYRKDSEGNEITVDIYENGENGTLLEIAKTNSTSTSTTYTLSNIAKNSVVKLKRSLGGKYTYVEFYLDSDDKQVVSDFDDDYLYLGSSYTEYKFSDYYKNYVAPTVSLEKDITVTPYLNGDGEIVWLNISAISLNTGYIMYSRYEDNLSGDDTLKITFITTGTSPKAKTYSVTKNTKINGIKCSEISDPELGTSINYIYNTLIKNSAVINEGKTVNSEEDDDKITAQPFMYNISGDNFTHIEIVNVDEENRITNATRKELTYSSSGKYFKNEDTKYSLGNSVLIFVPDDRTGYGESAYAMGTASQLSSKLKNNHYYYVEPYYRKTTASDGTTGTSRDLYVVYYEEPDKTPRYYNDNVVVEELKLDPSTQRYKLSVLSGTQGSGSKSFNVYCASGGDVSQSIMAYVLDENFERMKDEEDKYVKRTIEKGDVIRFGKLPDGRIVNMEIIFDISEDILERKYGLYTSSKKLDILDFDDYENVVQLFSQVGLVKDDFERSEEDTEIELSLALGDNATADRNLYVQTSAKVYSYDFTTDESDKFGSEITTVNDINIMTDMVYVNQIQKSGELSTSYIYVVRYNEDIQAKYQEYKESLENPDVPADTDETDNTGETDETEETE